MLRPLLLSSITGWRTTTPCTRTPDWAISHPASTFCPNPSRVRFDGVNSRCQEADYELAAPQTRGTFRPQRYLPRSAWRTEVGCGSARDGIARSPFSTSSTEEVDVFSSQEPSWPCQESAP